MLGTWAITIRDLIARKKSISQCHAKAKIFRPAVGNFLAVIFMRWYFSYSNQHSGYRSNKTPFTILETRRRYEYRRPYNNDSQFITLTAFCKHFSRLLTSRGFSFEAISASVGFIANYVCVLSKITQRYLIGKWREPTNTDLLGWRRHRLSQIEHLLENYNKNSNLKCAPEPCPPLFTSQLIVICWEVQLCARAREGLIGAPGSGRFKDLK